MWSVKSNDFFFQRMVIINSACIKMECVISKQNISSHTMHKDNYCLLHSGTCLMGGKFLNRLLEIFSFFFNVWVVWAELLEISSDSFLVLAIWHSVKPCILKPLNSSQQIVGNRACLLYLSKTPGAFFKLSH